MAHELQAAVFSENALRNPLYATCPAPYTRVSSYLVIIGEHVEAKEPNTSGTGSDQKNI